MKDFNHRRRIIRGFGQMARQVGLGLRDLDAPNAERRPSSGNHQWSTLHVAARTLLDQAYFGTVGMWFHGGLLTVQRPVHYHSASQTTRSDGVALGHEASGGVDLFRSKKSPVKFNPASAVGFAYSETSDFADLRGGVVYDISTGLLFDAVWIEQDQFATHCDDRRVWPIEDEAPIVDTQRIVVTGYFNLNIDERARLEKAIVSSEPDHPDFGPYYDIRPGTGSSMLDLVQAAVLRRMDAVVDCRKFWPLTRPTDASLTLNEVAPAIPECLGRGWLVTDAFGRPWSSFKIAEPISLVAAAPALHAKLIPITSRHCKMLMEAAKSS